MARPRTRAISARTSDVPVAVPIAVSVVLLVVAAMWAFDRVQIAQLALGLGTGALIASLGMGIVLTYTGSGVVNFHNGAIAVYIAYVFHGLRGAFDGGNGTLYLPPLPNPLALIEGVWNSFVTRRADWIDLPNWPTSIDLDFTDGRMTFLTAFIVAVFYAAVLGLIFHFAIFRPLRSAPALAKVAASVGLFLLFLNIISLRFTSAFRPVAEPDLGKRTFRPFGDEFVIQREQLVAAILVVVATAWLIVVFRYTRFGLATRAAAENEKGAALLGYSSDVLAGANWVLSTVLAGVVGITVSGITGLDPVTLPFLIIPALGAALLGKFTNFGVTMFAGLAIGMAQSLTKTYTAKAWFPRDWIPQTGLEKALPFFVIVAVLVVSGRNLPERGSLRPARLPTAPKVTRLAAPIATCSAVMLGCIFLLRFDWRQASINTMIGATLALSLVVITGYVGQISLAHAGLAGVAGFFMSKWFQGFLPFPLAPIAGAIVATGFGLLVALPALRVRGVNLAIVTLAAALAIEELIFKNPKLAGTSGALQVDPPSIFGTDFGPGNTDLRILGVKAFRDERVPPQVWFAVLCLVVVVIMMLVVINIRRSPTGRRFLAVRSNEVAAAAAGVSIANTKMIAFGLSAFIAGIGGALSGYRFGSVAPSNFGVVASITLLAFAYLGGISSVTGSIAAGVIGANALMFTFLDKNTGIDPKFTGLLAGFGLIISAVANPEGIAGGLRAALAKRRRRPWERSPDDGEPHADVEPLVLQ